MDFLRRLFGGGQGSAPADEPASPTAEPPADPEPATPGESVPDPSPTGATEVIWHKVEATTSTYRGEVDGVHVATIEKLPPDRANGAAWEWRLEGTVEGEGVGHAKRLKDAKPAAEDAVAARQA